MMEYQNISLEKALNKIIDKLTKIGGTGGIIGLDKNGNIYNENKYRWNVQSLFKFKRRNRSVNL